jgi:hypothetical protein
VAAIVALLVLVPLGASRASAQESPGGDAPIVQSWALAPTGTDPSEPSTRPSLSYTAEPGATVNDSVTLWNYGNVQLTFRVYATDAFNNADGAFDLLAGSKAPTDLGAWVSVPVQHVTVPAHNKVDLPLTLTVPAGAEPGDHAAAILASNEAQGTGADGKTVTVDRRTGTRIYLRVGGPLRPALAVTKAHTTYHGSADPRKGELEVTYTVRNVGNVRLGAAPTISVKNIFGRTMKKATPDPIAELLPGNEVTLTRHFTDIAATVRVGAQIQLTPRSVGGGQAAEADTSSRTASTWAAPWLLLFLAVAIALLVRGVRWWREREQPVAPR